MLRKTIPWAVAAFAVFYIATRPAAAAVTAHGLWHGAYVIASGFARFLNSL